MGDATLMIVAIDAESRAKSDLAKFDDVEAVLRACMRGAKNHWMVTNQEDQCRGAIAACHKLVDEAGKARIEASLNQLQALNALMSGVPVDLDALAKKAEDAPEPLPIAKIWAEIQAESDQ